MKKLTATVLAASLVASTAYAGGPVIVEEETEVVAEQPATSVGVLPLVLIVVGICVLFCGSDDDPPPPPLVPPV